MIYLLDSASDRLNICRKQAEEQLQLKLQEFRKQLDILNEKLFNLIKFEPIALDFNEIQLCVDEIEMITSLLRVSSFDLQILCCTRFELNFTNRTRN